MSRRFGGISLWFHNITGKFGAEEDNALSEA